MALRFLLVSLVAGMGCELPGSDDLASWNRAGRAWVGARMAELSEIRGGAEARQSRAAAARPTADDERAEVETALSRTAGNISRAAVLLGLSRHGLKKRMLRLGLRAKAGEEG